MLKNKVEINIKKTKKKGAYAARSKKKSSGRKPLYIAIGFFVVALAIGIGFFVYANGAATDMANYDYIFPNVYIAGVNVGGLTEAQALDKISDVVENSYAKNTLSVRLPDRTLRFPPEVTNIVIDAEEAVAAAYAYGREGGKYDVYKAYQAAQSTEHYIDLTSEFSIDYDAIRAIIDEAEADIESKKIESNYTINNDETGEPASIMIQVGAVGRSLDADALYDRVINAFMNNDFTDVEFGVSSDSPERIDLEKLYNDIYVESKDAGYDSETGKFTEEVVGRSFDLQAGEQQLLLANEGSTVTITISTDYPEVTRASLEGKLFRDVLNKDGKTVTSELSGSSAGRTTNVTLACKAINETVLQPGETFSFNKVVGERTSEKGYMNASIYINGKTEDGTGGGVCQVASTIYYAALLANLEIVERDEHMFRVTYVPLGMDATIFWGSLDFKFKNNTEYPIRIDAWVDGGGVNIQLWGTNEDGSYVEMEYIQKSTTNFDYVTQESDEYDVGYQSVTQYGYTGYTADTYRILYDASGKQISRTFEDSSTYKKRDQITTVGTRGAEPEEETPPEGEGSEVTSDPGTEVTANPNTEPSPVTDPSPEPSPDTSIPDSSSETPVDMPTDNLPFEILG